MPKKITGIYQILNLTNGKSYVGSSSDIKKRFSRHKYNLKNDKHGNPYLRNAWNKYGEGCFKFSILEECKIEELESKEQYWCDYYKVNGGVYNLRTCVNSNNGFKHSDESRKKMSDSQKGKKRLPRTRNIVKDKLFNRDGVIKKRGEALKGKKQSKETIEKRVEKLKGQKRTDEQKQRMSEVKQNMSDETKKKMSESQTGRICTEEMRKKLSNSHKGKKHTEESRKKMSKVQKNVGRVLKGELNPFYGKKHTDEAKKKQSEAHKGKKCNDETRKRMSEAARKDWEKRKGKIL